MSGVAYYIIGIVILLAFKVWWDHRAKNKQGRIINHSLSAGIDGALYVVSAFLLIFLLDKHSLFDAAGAVCIAVSFRWTFFDAIFGKLNWNQWEFYGKSSRLDRFLDKMDQKHELLDNLIKLIPAMIGIALILIF